MHKLLKSDPWARKSSIFFIQPHFFFQKIAREVLEESCREEIDFWKFFFKILRPTEQVAF